MTDTITVAVKCWDGTITRLKVNSDEELNTVKKYVYARTGVPPGDQTIQGQCLHDNSRSLQVLYGTDEEVSIEISHPLMRKAVTLDDVTPILDLAHVPNEEYWRDFGKSHATRQILHFGNFSDAFTRVSRLLVIHIVSNDQDNFFKSIINNDDVMEFISRNAKVWLRSVDENSIKMLSSLFGVDRVKLPFTIVATRNLSVMDVIHDCANDQVFLRRLVTAKIKMLKERRLCKLEECFSVKINRIRMVAAVAS
mmetsp:Transcript_30059/g.33575  ORF Transcript_30059/g.33575 Transcript_30059/m.33575 type:complete len:252 (+) Transcript_30059:40-795(+)